MNSMTIGDKVIMKNGTRGKITGFADVGEEKPRLTIGYTNILGVYMVVDLKPEDVEADDE